MPRSATRLGMGIVVGGLLAVGATVAQRELLRRAGTAATALTTGERGAAEAFYRDALLRIEPMVAAAIGADLPRALETPVVVDRVNWIDLNLATFEELFGRVERIVTEGTVGADT